MKWLMACAGRQRPPRLGNRTALGLAATVQHHPRSVMVIGSVPTALAVVNARLRRAWLDGQGSST